MKFNLYLDNVVGDIKKAAQYQSEEAAICAFMGFPCIAHAPKHFSIQVAGAIATLAVKHFWTHDTVDDFVTDAILVLQEKGDEYAEDDDDRLIQFTTCKVWCFDTTTRDWIFNFAMKHWSSIYLHKTNKVHLNKKQLKEKLIDLFNYCILYHYSPTSFFSKYLAI